MANLLFTNYQDRILSGVCENRRLLEVSLEERGNASILGNIYVGRVENVVKSINAAFVEISRGVKGYYSLEENKKHIFLNHKNSDKVCIGDLMLVQVERDAVKTKAPILTCDLNISGTYVALSGNISGVNVSNKIRNKSIQKLLREKLKEYTTEDFGFVARTNCEGLFEVHEEKVFWSPEGSELLLDEVKRITEEYRNIRQFAPTRPAFTVMKGSLPGYLEQIKNARMEQVEEIITDDVDIYQNIKENTTGVVWEKLRLYQDSLLPLTKLYSIETQLQDALRERVWLKSGGYLVIQPTEALTVIDVNTGKFVAGKTNEDREDGFYKVNCEAAVEIARQLRLRNYSGIIIVDFIDMKKQKHNDELMKLLEDEVSKDPVPTTVMDITKLGLVEMTRKKIKRPLFEQIKER